MGKKIILFGINNNLHLEPLVSSLLASRTQSSSMEWSSQERSRQAVEMDLDNVLVRVAIAILDSDSA